MIRHKSLVMIFSDLLGDFEPILKALHRLRFAGHDVILFHILDEAEALFPFEGMLELEDNETNETLLVDAEGIKADYLEEVAAFQAGVPQGVPGARIDYIPLHTGMPFDKALMSYLLSRQARVSGPGRRHSSRRGNMDISLINAGLAAGAALAALPVILHLFMRQTPKRVDLPRPPADPRAAEAVEEAAPRQELAPAAGADGAARPDGAGPGPAEAHVGGVGRRPGGADGDRPGLRHEPVDGLQAARQDPARRGQGAGPRTAEQDARVEPRLRHRLGRAGRPQRLLPRPGAEADRSADARGT